jgi:CRP-like cAMP-binding protein
MIQVDTEPWSAGTTGGASHAEFLGWLLQQHPVRRVSRGHVLCLQGEPADALYVLIDGEATLTTTCESGNEFEISSLKSGDVVGIEAVCGDRYLATAQAVAPCRVAIVSRKNFFAHLQTHPRLATAVLSRIVAELCALRERLSDLCSRSAAQRLALHLLRLADPENELRVALPWGSRAKLSRRLAMKQETLSRSLRKLSRKGLVRVLRGELIVLDREGLREFGG